MPLGTTGYAILEGYPQESMDEQRLFEATVVYIGPAANRYELIKEIFGYIETSPFNVFAPRPYPNFNSAFPVTWTGKPYLDDASPEQFGTTAPIDDFDDPLTTACDWQIEVVYKQIAITRDAVTPPAPGTWLEISRRGEIEQIELPGRFIKWDTGFVESLEVVGGVIQQPGGGYTPHPTTPQPSRVREDELAAVYTTSTRLNVSWKEALLPNWTYIDSMLGAVNIEPFLGWPKFGLMFIDYSYKEEIDMNGTTKYEVDFELVAKTRRQPNFADGNYPDSVTNERIGMWGRAFEPANGEFLLNVQWDSLDTDPGFRFIYPLATATQFANLFSYVP